MSRRPVDPLPDDPDSAPGRYYDRLVPLVEALLEAGNRLVHDNGDRGFIPQPDGYNAYLTEPIDFDLLEQLFALPPELRLDREHDRLVDERTFATIYGGRAGEHFARWGGA